MMLVSSCSSKHAERQVHTFQELRFIRYRRRHGNVDLHSVRDSFFEVELPLSQTALKRVL